MIKQKRFAFINAFGSHLVDYELEFKEFSSSIVDKTYFVPVTEQLKTLNGTAHSDVGSYHFKDGDDSGVKLPFYANERKPDLAVLSQVIHQEKTAIDKVVKKAKEKATAVARAEAEFQARKAAADKAAKATSD